MQMQFDRGKIVFSTNAAEAVGYLLGEKNEPRSKPHTWYKNELKMDHRFKCKM